MLESILTGFSACYGGMRSTTGTGDLPAISKRYKQTIADTIIEIRCIFSQTSVRASAFAKLAARCITK